MGYKVCDGTLKHRLSIPIQYIGNMCIVYPHLRVIDAFTDEADGHILVTKVRVHHICKYGILFAFAVYHNTQQSAKSLLLVAVEHLQCKQVVGRRTDVGVEYYQRHARIFLRDIRIIAVTTTT